MPLASIPLVANHRDVYEPSDDSFVLVDALAAAIPTFKMHHHFVCVEIGSGSGYVVCSAALLLKEAGISCHCLAMDINPQATITTLETLTAHQLRNVDVIMADMLGPISKRLNGAVDLLIFNPPYVPTPNEEVMRMGIAQAWAGGCRGRVVIDRLLPMVKDLLAPAGHFFMVTVAENNPLGILDELSILGLSGKAVLQRQADEEHLTILHVVKP